MNRASLPVAVLTAFLLAAVSHASAPEPPRGAPDGLDRTFERRQSFAGEGNPARRAELAIRMLLAGRAGGAPLAGIGLQSVEIEDATVTVRLEVPAALLASTTRAEAELVVENIEREVVAALEPLAGLRVFRVLGRTDTQQPFVPLDRLLGPAPAVRTKPGEVGRDGLGGPPGLGYGQPQGALSGKSIFLSQSHGWLYYTTLGTWSTQRGITNGIVEDFINAEAIDQYLIQYLWNAGAQVFTARERDLDARMVIVDNDGGNGTSDYLEAGSGWITSTASGFGNGNAPYASGVDPFSLGTARVLATTASETGRVTFVPDVPADGYYWIQISYPGSSNRAPDAHVIVNHDGGTTHFRLNQQLDGHTWRPLGMFYLRAGKDAARGSVAIANDSTSSATYIAADAVRIGGGMGDVVDGGTVSGHPRWEEGARAHTQYLGFNTAGNGDVTTRPLWAEWECEAGEDCLYFSWHTNAPNPGTGTSSYIYDGGATAGSSQLQSIVHDEIVKDVRSGWDPGWRDRGKLQANFGELRPLTSMPGMLLELAFHDTPYDATQLKQPEFRQLAARAIYQGMARYYDGNAVLLPEPPEELVVRNLGAGTVRVEWQPAPPDGLDLGGDPATGYRVYVSLDGHGWQDAVATSATTHTLSNLTVGQVYYVRVSATNAGGESFPTETLAVRASQGLAPMLIVSGFDRIDGSALISQTDTIGTNLRMQLLRMNSFDYTIAHGEAIAAAGVDFDSATNDAVIAARLALTDYEAVDWILGEESTADHTFDASEQGLVAAFLAGGGDLFVSGAEIGWDLVAQANGQSFYEGSLRATYEADDAYGGASNPRNEADGVAGSVFDGVTGIVFDGAPPTIYDVDFPDVLGTINGSAMALRYVNATAASDGAAIQYDGAYKLVHIGFPFEAILDPGMRATLMGRIIAFFGVTTGGVTYHDLATGAGLGDPNPNTVKVFTPDGSGNPITFTAYGAGKWGTNVASGVLTNGGTATVLTGPGPGTVYGPHVRGFDRTGTPRTGLSFYSYGTLKFGVNAAHGGIDAAAGDEVLTGAGPGAVFGPHVRAFRYTGAAVQALSKVSYFAFATLKYGVNVAGGDIDADGFDELVAGAGPSAVFGASVRGFDYDGGSVSLLSKVNFIAWAAGTGYGANVASADVDADARAEILVAKGPGPTLAASVRGYRYAGTLALLGIDFSAYAGTLYGARVGAGDVAGDGRAELLTGPGRDPAAPSNVRAYAYDPAGNTTSKLPVPDFTAFAGLGYGVNVTGADLAY